MDRDRNAGDADNSAEADSAMQENEQETAVGDAVAGSESDDSQGPTSDDTDVGVKGLDVAGEDRGPGDSGKDNGGSIQPAAGSSNLAAGVIGAGFWIVILSIFGFNYFGLGDTEFDVVVAASPNYDNTGKTLENWSVSGHIIYDNDFVANIDVWAIAVDQQGNRKSTGKYVSDAKGKFDLEKIPNSLSGQPNQTIIEIAVHASGAVKLGQGKDEETIEVKPAMTRVGIGSGQQYRVINLPFKELVVIGMIFALSVAIALIPVPQGSKTSAWLVGKYLSSVFFAFLLTGFMVLYISLGLRHVNQTASNVENEILSLGVANIYKGRYVDDVPNEWLISLTSPTFLKPIGSASDAAAPGLAASADDINQRGVTDPAQQDGDKPADKPDSDPSENQLERGLGAPLWVLLVAVIGSALFTISIILVGIKEAPLQLLPEEIRNRIQAVVLHQFYILFAPLGAIFVYQLLVMAGAASQTVSVAIIALAAGIALNYMLEKARTSVENLISSSK